MARRPSSAVEGFAAVEDPWPGERAVRVALAEQWGLRGELGPMRVWPASRTWLVDGHIVKLVRDERSHVRAGLLASEAVDRAGITTGAPVRTRADEVCVALPFGPESWVLAVLHRVDGTHLSMWVVPPAIMGAFLGRLHRILLDCPTAGAWTPDDVVGHMRRGITAGQPPPVREMILQAVSEVSAYYTTAPRRQLLYGDGPGIFSTNGTDITAIIDWGGVRAGSIADDIGCWTAHGASGRITLPDYTAAFLEGYRHRNDLPAAEAAAVPLFQRLRIASRACYVSDPAALARVEAWMARAFAD